MCFKVAQTLGDQIFNFFLIDNFRWIFALNIIKLLGYKNSFKNVIIVITEYFVSLYNFYNLKAAIIFNAQIHLL